MKRLIGLCISLAITLCVCIGSSLAAEPRLPDFLALPAGMAPTAEVTEEAYGEADFPRPDHGANVQSGHHWQVGLGLKGVADDTPGKALWQQVKAALLKGGWTVTAEFDESPFGATARLQRGHDAWAHFDLYGPDDIRLEMVEVAASKLNLKMSAPSQTPERSPLHPATFRTFRRPAAA